MNRQIVLAMAVCALTTIPVCAQETNASGAETTPERSDSTKTTYAPAPAAWGDEAASHAWEMSAISGDLEGKLDSKSAKVGDRVVLRTTVKAQTSDGTVIPAGSLLVGHVTAVQVHDDAHRISQISIAFDRVELRGGLKVAIYTMIRGATRPAYAGASGGMYGGGAYGNEGSMGADVGGGRVGGGYGTMRGEGQTGAGGLNNDAGSLDGGALDRSAPVAGPASANANTGVGLAANSAVQLAGHGDLNAGTGAHDLAKARATPRPTGIPGVMLAGSSTASGVFSAAGKDIELERGTQMQLGIVANR